jgi:hypothetical protein
MRLERFRVQGYKNFRAPLQLADLGRFNVLHGDNNVGKSNLLESIGLFRLRPTHLTVTLAHGWLLSPRGTPVDIDDDRLPRSGGSARRACSRRSAPFSKRQPDSRAIRHATGRSAGRHIGALRPVRRLCR